MSVEFWTNAEQFYEVWLFIISVFTSIGLIVLLFVLNYSSKKILKKNLSTVFGGIFVLVLIGYIGHLRYEPYLKEAGHVNPLTRDRKPTLIGYQYYSKSEQQSYKQFNDLESLRDMDLYEEERIVVTVDYLGESGYFHYFANEDGEVFKQHRDVLVKENIQQAQVVGSRFVLKDDAFKEIGFKNPENTMFERTEIPSITEGKNYKPENDFLIPTTREILRRWNF